MPDVMTTKQRSYCMSQIRGRNTGPELKLRRALWNAGLRYRLVSRLPGRPDIFFSRQKVAIFVDGCFWHGCPQHRIAPKSNGKFWSDKLSRTLERDRGVDAQLDSLGWTVLRYWEHEVEASPAKVAAKIKRVLLRNERTKVAVKTGSRCRMVAKRAPPSR